MELHYIDRLSVVLFSSVALLMTPLVLPVHQAQAIVLFGGTVTPVYYCHNAVVQVYITGPVPASLVVNPANTTAHRAYGPPITAGQQTLGIQGVPYFCVYTYVPVTVGIYAPSILISGSSGL